MSQFWTNHRSNKSSQTKMKTRNISVDQAKKIAKNQGYSEPQIENLINQAGKDDLKDQDNLPNATLDIPKIENSNNTNKLGEKSSTDEKNLELMDNKTELEIIEDDLKIETGSQYATGEGLSYFGYDIFSEILHFSIIYNWYC